MSRMSQVSLLVARSDNVWLCPCMAMPMYGYAHVAVYCHVIYLANDNLVTRKVTHHIHLVLHLCCIFTLQHINLSLYCYAYVFVPNLLRIMSCHGEVACVSH